MNKLLLSRLLVAFLFAVPLTALVVSDGGSLESERRRMAAFPEMPPKLRSRYVKNFFQGIDTFFADRFPARTSLLGLSRTLHEIGGDSLDMDKCYRGRENWLFLGNSYARCVDKLQGKATLSGENLKRQTEKYKTLHEAARSCGAEFFVFIGPNKSGIYPEYLPPVIIPAQRRFIVPLLSSLRETGVRIYDPSDRLLKTKAAGLLYYRTDTHWNARGAYAAFKGFSEQAGLPEPESPSFAEIPAHRGDLVDIGGYQSFPLSAGDNFTPQWSVPPAPHEIDGLILNAQAAGDKTAWVFGDSFAEALKPYLMATFKEIRFFTHEEFDAAVASQYTKPDMIIWVVVERNFARPD